MLFESSLRRELARSFGAALVVILTVVLTVLLVRTLGQASRGEIDPQTLVLFLTYTLLGQLPVVLTAALLAGTVATLSRWYRDSEMVIWRICGLGLARFWAPIARFAWPVWLAVAALTLGVSPWSEQQRFELRLRYQQRGDLERVVPGQFQESAGGRRVFFIDRDRVDEHEGRQVFIATEERDGTQSVVSARRARVLMRDGQTYLVLEDGQRLQYPANTAADGALQLGVFDRYWLRVTAASATSEAAKRSATPTWTLLRAGDLASQGELAWRAGLVLSAINVVLLAMAAVTAHQRLGKSGNIALVLLVFITYYNLMGIGKDLIARGSIGPLALMLVLHGGVGLLAWLWMLHREQPWWQRLTQRQRAASNAQSWT